jgi:cobalt-zinc-cadmium efflux system protein
MTQPYPPEIAADIGKARRLCWWTIAWMISVIAVIGLTMGSSQAMRTAWIEDILSIVPSIVLLVSTRLERKEPTALYPHGFNRAHSLSFMIAAVALAVMGSLLLVESIITLATRDHVTIPSVTLFGQQIWLGWLMIAALAYSVIPPLILGHMKLPVAARLHDEVLHTDAKMQKADWMTGLAGIAGILGIGAGIWWADAAAAGIIAFSILNDGIRALRIATAELVDGVPRELDSARMASDARALCEALQRRWPDATIRVRESGRYILAQVRGVVPPGEIDLKQIWPGDPDCSWRLAQISFVPPEPQSRPG